MFKILYNIIFFSTFLLSLQGQNSQTNNLLKKHIEYLASDSLEGRLTGTQGEKLALDYIVKEFEEIGLTPLGSNDGWTQAFEFKDGVEILEDKNQLIISNKKLELNKDYFILNKEINTSISGKTIDVGYGIEAPSLNYNDYKKINTKKLKDKIFIIHHGHPENGNPHSDFIAYEDYNTKIDNAQKHGAQGVIFVVDKYDDFSEIKKNYVLSGHKTVTYEGIPVLLFGEYKKYLNTSKGDIELTLQVSPSYKTGHNVIGFIDNKKSNTVIIGAHYDHLGYGEHGSLFTGSKAIHNGADDNASGVALVLELARQLKDSDFKKNNYLFICFSGEELGLYGSNFYTKNPTLPLAQGNYMLNFDMIGRLDPDSKKLVVNGTGTSPAWEVLEKMSSDDIQVKMNPSGIGPSDHMQFYLNDIPALHFFTGAHEDYHKPSDDADKINYEGLIAINKLMIDLIGTLDGKEKLSFTKTKEEENKEETPRFTVGLGVIPDYLFDGIGMRIDGVKDGKVADKAGFKKGDVVIEMGTVKVVDMMSYMKALSLFSKGDQTTVKVKRGEEIIESEITFF